ncbi:MAG: MFS transporter [Anaerolineales bacterium]|nr:MFS transporter [Anaerolineales bacterium]
MIAGNISRLKSTYPRQFWLMFLGMLISTIGASMIWPFLMIYVSSRLELPMTAVASLLTINSAVILASSFLAGPLIDRYGRKWMMVASLALNGGYFLLLGQAHSYLAFAGLMVWGGLVNPVYRVGADAMMADLVPPEKRVDAYSLLRLSNNAGIAIGPAIGGFIASSSYNLAFFIAAAGMLIYSLLLLVFARETLPTTQGEVEQRLPKEKWGGYLVILRDRSFIKVVLFFTMVTVCAATMWVLMPVYAKQNFGVQERQYGFIPTTNAIMVVALQVLTTQITKRHAPLLVMAVGAAFYTLATGSVSLATGFWGFWIAMVIMSIGELVIVPTSSTYVANQAPPDKRGRYMSIYGLSWGLATGIGSLLGGFLNDTFGPKAIWYGAFAIGSIAVIGYLAMYAAHKRTPIAQPTQIQASPDPDL